jgi:hypothetical protein
MECYQICSGLVHMGDMKFKEKKEQAEPDGTEEAKKVSLKIIFKEIKK